MNPREIKWNPADNGVSMTLTFALKTDGTVHLRSETPAFTQEYSSINEATEALTTLLTTGAKQAQN